MELIKLIVFVSALITKICLAGLNTETSEPDKSRLVEETINLLESCYGDPIGTVGLTGALAGCISKTLSTREILIPGTLIDDTSRIVNNGPVSRTSRYKLQVFVVTVTNSSTLAKTLMHIKKSVWWNHMASFILLDGSVSKNGCSNAYEMLWEAWKIDLLNSKFMCAHRSKGTLIYTYNPYTIDAPVPWQLEKTYKGKNDHNIGLFVQVYREDKTICDLLDFDKTTSDIGGSEIRASVQGLENWWYMDPDRKPTILNRAQNVSAQALISTINAIWTFLLYPETYSRSVNKNGTPSGDIPDVVNGISDISLNVRNRIFTENYTTLYPHVGTTLAIITQYRGNMSQLDKIVSLLDSYSRFGLLLVCLITLLFFKCYLHKPLMTAMLDLVLIVCNAAFLKTPKKLGPRIYLGCLFLFAVTIQGIYQGALASLLTKRKPLPNVNTIEDLVRFDYTIYGHEIFYPYFEGSALDGRYVKLSSFNCTNYVLRDSKAACVYIKLGLIDEAAQFNLHLSYDISMYIYGSYLIRSDWPLEGRVNTILQRCFEGDLLKPLYAAERDVLMHVMDSHENEGQNQTFKVLNMGELSFAFVILGIGLGLATISFIIEIGIGRSRIAISLNPIRRLAYLANACRNKMSMTLMRYMQPFERKKSKTNNDPSSSSLSSRLKKYRVLKN